MGLRLWISTCTDGKDNDIKLFLNYHIGSYQNYGSKPTTEPVVW